MTTNLANELVLKLTLDVDSFIALLKSANSVLGLLMVSILLLILEAILSIYSLALKTGLAGVGVGGIATKIGAVCVVELVLCGTFRTMGIIEVWVEERILNGNWFVDVVLGDALSVSVLNDPDSLVRIGDAEWTTGAIFGEVILGAGRFVKVVSKTVGLKFKINITDFKLINFEFNLHFGL